MVNCPPSSAHRWSKCSLAPSFIECGSSEHRHSQTRIEGLAAHWVADLILGGDATDVEDLLGRTSPHGYVVTEEMCGHVKEFVDRLCAVSLEVHNERHVIVSPHIRGRLDAEISSDDAGLHVFELKYGWKIVEPEYNSALMLYARGLMQPRHEVINLHVFQPRPSHRLGAWRTWSTSREVIIQHTDYLIERAVSCQVDNPIATPGTWCLDCPGAAKCHALGLNTHAWMDIVESQWFDAHPSPEELGRQLRFLRAASQLLEARLNGVTAIVESQMSSGKYVPGWMFKERVGKRKFNVPPDIIDFVTGVPATKPQQLTPSEMERKGVSRRILDQITTRPSIGKELVEATPEEFERIFKND